MPAQGPIRCGNIAFTPDSPGRGLVRGSKRNPQGGRQNPGYTYGSCPGQGVHRHRFPNHQRISRGQRPVSETRVGGDRATELFSQYARAQPGVRAQPDPRHYC